MYLSVLAFADGVTLDLSLFNRAASDRCCITVEGRRVAAPQRPETGRLNGEKMLRIVLSRAVLV
jgi:hypothetical protein